MKRCSESVSVSKLPIKAQLLWHRILEHVDPWGVMVGDAPLVRALCVSATCGDEITVDDVEAALRQFEELGMIWRYEVEGAQYIATRKHEEYSWKVRRPAPLLPMTQEVVDSRDFSKYRSTGTRWKNVPDKLQQWADRYHLTLPEGAIPAPPPPKEVLGERTACVQPTGGQCTANGQPLSGQCTANVQPTAGQRTANVQPTDVRRTDTTGLQCVKVDAPTRSVPSNGQQNGSGGAMAANVQPMYSQCTANGQPAYSHCLPDGILSSVVLCSEEKSSVVLCSEEKSSEEKTQVHARDQSTHVPIRPKDYYEKLQDARMGTAAINWTVVDKDALDAMGGQDVWLYATALDIIAHHDPVYRAREWIQRRSAGCMPGAEEVRQARRAFGLDGDRESHGRRETQYTCGSCGHTYAPRDAADILCPQCGAYIGSERRRDDEGQGAD